MIISGLANRYHQAVTQIQPIVRDPVPNPASPLPENQGGNGNFPISPDAETNRNQTDSDRNAGSQNSGSPSETEGLTDAEKRLVQELKQADQAVRRHEMAHVAAGGRYITSGANFGFKRGPDGQNYAVSGEVTIDTAPIPGDPEATMAKMRQIKAAALAPADPSPQDIKVASMATALATKAMSELMTQQAGQKSSQEENKAFGSIRNAAETYSRVGNLTQTDESTFDIAV